ncbi:MAG: hypothetical protein ACKOPI_02020, partial [bacterium]
MYRKEVRRRRTALAVLVVAGLTMLSLYFQEGPTGPLHTGQGLVSNLLGPVEEGANRALKPPRDLVNWFSETFDARGENARPPREPPERSSSFSPLCGTCPRLSILPGGLKN